MTTVRIPWTIQTDNESYWNEVCAWAIERFGLPGDRFFTTANVDYMDFHFVSDKDAIMFSLKYNGKTIGSEQQTLEFVGGKINGF